MLQNQMTPLPDCSPDDHFTAMLGDAFTSKPIAPADASLLMPLSISESGNSWRRSARTITPTEKGKVYTFVAGNKENTGVNKGHKRAKGVTATTKEKGGNRAVKRARKESGETPAAC
jgi:hypothetical protein